MWGHPHKPRGRGLSLRVDELIRNPSFGLFGREMLICQLCSTSGERLATDSRRREAHGGIVYSHTNRSTYTRKSRRSVRAQTNEKGKGRGCVRSAFIALIFSHFPIQRLSIIHKKIQHSREVGGDPLGGTILYHAIYTQSDSQLAINNNNERVNFIYFQEGKTSEC